MRMAGLPFLTTLSGRQLPQNTCFVHCGIGLGWVQQLVGRAGLGCEKVTNVHI